MGRAADDNGGAQHDEGQARGPKSSVGLPLGGEERGVGGDVVGARRYLDEEARRRDLVKRIHGAELDSSDIVAWTILQSRRRN